MICHCHDYRQWPHSRFDSGARRKWWVEISNFIAFCESTSLTISFFRNQNCFNIFSFIAVVRYDLPLPWLQAMAIVLRSTLLRYSVKMVSKYFQIHCFLWIDFTNHTPFSKNKFLQYFSFYSIVRVRTSFKISYHFWKLFLVIHYTQQEKPQFNCGKLSKGCFFAQPQFNCG